MSELDPIVMFVPEKCSGCGVQCDLAMHLAGATATKNAIEQMGESLVGESGERFDALIEAELPEGIAEHAKEQIRQTVGTDIEKADQTIKEVRDEISANALSCSGVLKMRASKDGVTYTVDVCTSPRIYMRNGVPTQVPTHIRTNTN